MNSKGANMPKIRRLKGNNKREESAKKKFRLDDLKSFRVEKGAPTLVCSVKGRPKDVQPEQNTPGNVFENGAIYECLKCGDRFSQAAALQLHSRTHYPHACVLCYQRKIYTTVAPATNPAVESKLVVKCPPIQSKLVVKCPPIQSKRVAKYSPIEIKRIARLPIPRLPKNREILLIKPIRSCSETTDASNNTKQANNDMEPAELVNIPVQLFHRDKTLVEAGNLNLLRCKICNFLFERQSQYREHYSIHHEGADSSKISKELEEKNIIKQPVDDALKNNELGENTMEEAEVPVADPSGELGTEADTEDITSCTLLLVPLEKKADSIENIAKEKGTRKETQEATHGPDIIENMENDECLPDELREDSIVEGPAANPNGELDIEADADDITSCTRLSVPLEKKADSIENIADETREETQEVTYKSKIIEILENDECLPNRLGEDSIVESLATDPNGKLDSDAVTEDITSGTRLLVPLEKKADSIDIAEESGIRIETLEVTNESNIIKELQNDECLRDVAETAAIIRHTLIEEIPIEATVDLQCSVEPEKQEGTQQTTHDLFDFEVVMSNEGSTIDANKVLDANGSTADFTHHTEPKCYSMDGFETGDWSIEEIDEGSKSTHSMEIDEENTSQNSRTDALKYSAEAQTSNTTPTNEEQNLETYFAEIKTRK